MSLLNLPRDQIYAPFQALNQMLNRSVGGNSDHARSATGVLWGVVRREGLSDIDDPSAHAGLAQHAYPVNADDQAICGYRPPRHRTLFSSRPRVELAAPSSTYNPACERCVAAVGGPPDTEAGSMAEIEMRVEAAVRPPALQANDEPTPTDTLAHAAEFTHDVPSVVVAAPATVEVPRLRHGGLATIEPGCDTLTLRSRDLRAGAAIVANLEGAPRGLRVVSVSVHGRGLASVVLNRKVERPITVAWFVVSPPPAGSRVRAA